MKPKFTVKAEITALLTGHGWLSGMEIESHGREWRTKRIGRTLREMSSGESPLLEKSYTNDKHHAVLYRLSPPEPLSNYLNKQETQGVLL